MDIIKLSNTQYRKGVLLAHSSYEPEDNFNPVGVGAAVQNSGCEGVAAQNDGVNVTLNSPDGKHRYSITLHDNELERICRIHSSQTARAEKIAADIHDVAKHAGVSISRKTDLGPLRIRNRIRW